MVSLKLQRPEVDITLAFADMAHWRQLIERLIELEAVHTVDGAFSRRPPCFPFDRRLTAPADCAAWQGVLIFPLDCVHGRSRATAQVAYAKQFPLMPGLDASRGESDSLFVRPGVVAKDVPSLKPAESPRLVASMKPVRRPRERGSGSGRRRGTPVQPRLPG